MFLCFATFFVCFFLYNLLLFKFYLLPIVFSNPQPILHSIRLAAQTSVRIGLKTNKKNVPFTLTPPPSRALLAAFLHSRQCASMHGHVWERGQCWERWVKFAVVVVVVVVVVVAVVIDGKV